MTQPPQRRPRWRVVLPYIAAGMALLAGIIGGYWIPEIGFDGYVDSDGTYQRGKGIFDWLELLIVPLVLTGLALWVSRVDRANEQKLADERRASEQKLADERRASEQESAADHLREATLQTYFTRMAELLLDKGLDTSLEGAKIRDVARAYTLTTLRQLDSNRKGILLQFLYDSALIGQGQQLTPIIHMQGMDITHANLDGANLDGAYLDGAYLDRANLDGANLEGANLEGAYLRGAILEGAYLEGAYLRGAILRGAILDGANLDGAILDGAILDGANLSGANLDGANLDGAYLDGAYLGGANLNGAYLGGANLDGAYLDGANLDGAYLDGAIGLSRGISEKTSIDIGSASPQEAASGRPEPARRPCDGARKAQRRPRESGGPRGVRGAPIDRDPAGLA